MRGHQSSAREAPQKVAIRLVDSDLDLTRVKSLCWAYRSYLMGISPEDRAAISAIYPAPYYAALMHRLDKEHARPKGAIMVAEIGDRMVGCAMSRPLTDDVVESKRLFVSDVARGLGAGEALCLALMDQARADGYRSFCFETSKSLTTARRLYDRLGFQERGPYQSLPDAAAKQFMYYHIDL
ncbi:GNAT family N-acetyltransferase [Actibacterium sp. 188UL27-1]|uniref:GNAT family N-acetyltransferase n=1 Tax=Actibacterium sp. 188UL27-1 TaxID=2786961 RepID=UPI00195863F6|nr:GNAT family N-acetyltransferase [Actibacterium sp. 188UL27-1]MBM7067348.1 GNAT family N-acetyltransferase [Actibacterium sp. 188UL27-1]